MKQIKISKKSYDAILDAWVGMNTLCAYLESPELSSGKLIRERAKEIYKQLDAVVTKLPELPDKQ